jgi:hypothetical protein
MSNVRIFPLYHCFACHAGFQNPLPVIDRYNTTKACPVCGSYNIHERWKCEDEGRLGDRAHGPDRED